MDFLNKSLQQIKELFDSMSIGARIITALLAGVIVVSLVYLFQYRATSGEAYLLGGREFSQSELGAMEGALAEAGVTGFEIVGYRLKLPRSQYDAAVAALSRSGALPRSVDEVDDPNQSYNPLLTRAQEEERQKHEKKTKFRTQFSQNDKLEYAHLEYDTQIVGGLEKRRVTTAVVSAKAKSGKELDREMVDSLVAAVRGYLVGINSEDITVIDDRTLVHYRGMSQNSGSDPRNNPYAIAKSNYERYWRDKIHDRLRHYEPNVQVNVELDDTTSYIEQSQLLSNGVVTETESEKESNESNQPAAGGRPGVVPNTGAANSSASVATAGATTNSTQSREMTRTRPGATVSQTQRAPLVPKHVSVSIGVPESYYRRLWANLNPPAAGEEPKPMTRADLAAMETEAKREIERAIQPLLSNENQGQNIYEPIVVTTDYELPLPAAIPSSATDGLITWLNRNWQSLAMIGLGGFGLIMLRSMVKSAAGSSDAALANATAAAGDRGGSAGEGEEGSEEETRVKRKFEAGNAPSLKDELTELVNDDPDAAVSVLKQWIGEAA